MNGGGGAFISGGGGGGGSFRRWRRFHSSIILVSTASAILCTMRCPDRDDPPSNQDVQQNDNGNASEVLPGVLLMRKIHACFLQYQLFLLLLNPQNTT
jgi:hypothetical protein